MSPILGNIQYLRDFLFLKYEKIKRDLKIFDENFSITSDSFQMPKHYWITSYKQEIEINYSKTPFDFLKRYNIYPIIYKEKEHVFLERLFEELSKIQQPLKKK